MHTLDSVSQSIFKNFPDLSPEEKDDILASLEEFAKQYGPNFFNEKLNLVNAIRITSFKYILARNILADVTGENLHDVLMLHPLLEMQEPVFKKIDLLHKIKDRFPDYPETNLSAEEEKSLIIQIMDFSVQEVIKFSMMPQTAIGSFFSKNPGLFYFFFSQESK